MPMPRLVLLCLAPWGAAVALFAAARRAPDFVESAYSASVYPRLASLVGLPARAWDGLVPSEVGALRPSLSEVLVVALALGLALAGRRSWRRRAEESVLRRLTRLGLGLVGVAGWLVLLFIGVWGLQHARRPLLEGLGWEVEYGGGTPEMAAFAEWLADEAARLRASLAEDESGVVTIPADLFERVELAWERAGEARPLLDGPRPVLREPLASPLLGAARVSGIFSPFTGESHVAGGQPAVARGFTALHEVAHRRGWAREDEANGLAFLVGIESDDPYLRYSACSAMFSRVHFQVALYNMFAAGDIAEHLHPGHVRDLEARRAYWERERPAVVERFGEVATRTNDTYLRSMGSADGVASYGRMIDLGRAWWQQR